jgi:hypothetical protein
MQRRMRPGFTDRDAVSECPQIPPTLKHCCCLSMALLILTKNVALARPLPRLLKPYPLDGLDEHLPNWHPASTCQSSHRHLVHPFQPPASIEEEEPGRTLQDERAHRGAPNAQPGGVATMATMTSTNRLLPPAMEVRAAC